MALATRMPETPEELEGFIRGVVNRQVIELQRETLQELKQLGERQARVEGRVEELGRVVGLYREDFQGLREDFRSLEPSTNNRPVRFLQSSLWASLISRNQPVIYLQIPDRAVPGRFSGVAGGFPQSLGAI